MYAVVGQHFGKLVAGQLPLLKMTTRQDVEGAESLS